MRLINSILIAAFLLPIGYVPCAAQDGVILRGDEIDYNKLPIGIFVEVSYHSPKNKKTTAKGYIKAIEGNAFTLGRGLWKERIEYQDIITLKIEGFDPFALFPGSRIRITAPSLVTIDMVGTLAKLDADSLVIKTEDGRQLVVPCTSVAKFEVSHGQQSRAKTGAVWGLLAGAIPGFLFIDFQEKTTRATPGWNGLRPGTATETNPSKEGFAMFLLLCSASTITGIVIGAEIKNERWEQVALPVRFGISPQRHGGLALSASFMF
ncbi:MAG: hypothetical protein O2954_14540 [bacterium]|nr:hypothetical protein [bacterium]